MTKILWEPTKENIETCHLQRLKSKINIKFNKDLVSYSDLYNWSVNNISNFWETVWNDNQIIVSSNYTQIIDDVNKMPGAKWFRSSRLNYAENLLSNNSSKIAIEYFCEDKVSGKISYKELNLSVSKVAFSFRKMGLKSGDRVAAVITNIPEAIIAMLAVTSIGAVWSSCSPEFGVRGILDRFKQIQPKFLISINGYYFKGKKYNNIDKITSVFKSIDTVKQLILIESLDIPKPKGYISWSYMISNNAYTIDYEQLPFGHPLFIMFSSGTTGKPKSIVHSAGGTLIQHIKELKYHVNLFEEDKIFYFTTCGWMMWNWLVSSLFLGSTVVLYDGSPFYPKRTSLLEIMNLNKLTIFGTSAKYISYLESESIIPMKLGSFNNLKTILSTGSTLNDESYDFVYKHWKKDVQLSSISGGTDILSCFALGNPILPVYKGELQSIGLGMSVKSYNSKGVHKFNTKGELVCDKVFPSMPIYFWNDSSGRNYKKAYFNKFKKIWTHGDYISINNNYGVKIYGRSDATLNPGGVRIGTSEIYQSVDSIDFINDSLAVGQKIENDERIILFVKLDKNSSLTHLQKEEIKNIIRINCSSRHVPSKIIQIEDIPYTINGKKVELAVKNIIHGIEPENLASLENPKSLLFYENLTELEL